jgi:hypothetical protein
MNAEALLARHAAAWQAATVHPFLARVRDGTRGRTRRARSSARIWARSWSWPRWRHRHPESSPWIPAPWSGKCSQVLAGYHRAKRHGGADRVTSNALDGLLAAPTEQVFRRADRLPQDAEVLRTLEDAQPELLGEGYHVVTLCDPAHRLVVKDAKSTVTIPPLAPPAALSDRRACATDHGVGEDGRLHEAIWQHIRVFESYGQLTVPNRVYVAGDVFEQLDGDERRALDRFRALGIVRLMGDRALPVRPHYPSSFRDWKRPPEGAVAISVRVVQPWMTRLVDAIERDLRAGNLARVRGWDDRYRGFVQELWRHGVSHLDFLDPERRVTDRPEG